MFNHKSKKKNIKRNFSFTNNFRGLDPSQNYSSSDALSPDKSQMMMVQPGGGQIRGASATPTMQQRIKALGVATPLAMSSPVRRYAI